MALSTYEDLKTTLAAWTHRDDMTAYLDDFIDLTEAEINNTLRMSEMESSTSVAVTTADLSLPDGFVEMREIHVSDSPDTILEYKTPFDLERIKTDETGKPRFYTIKADAIELYPYGEYTIDMTYYKSVTALDDTNTSNFVLTRFPQIYLHGCLQQAYIWAHDQELAMAHGNEFNRQMQLANSKSNRRKFSGPLQVVAA